MESDKDGGGGKKTYRETSLCSNDTSPTRLSTIPEYSHDPRGDLYPQEEVAWILFGASATAEGSEAIATELFPPTRRHAALLPVETPHLRVCHLARVHIVHGIELFPSERRLAHLTRREEAFTVRGRREGWGDRSRRWRRCRSCEGSTIVSYPIARYPGTTARKYIG